MTNALDRIAPAPLTQATAVEQARAVAEVAAAVQVAQQCPRDIRRAWADMQDACSRLGLAERAFYKVPNRGQGPSVHLARELLRIWGNGDAGVHELSRDDERGQSEVRAFAWDQQTNVRQSRTFQVPHVRMVSGQRKPLTDTTDVYLLNQNVGARAVRECIFAILPADYVAEAQALCRKTIERGDGKPLPERISNMVSKFREIGVTVAQIEAKLGRPRGQWTAVDVADLAVVFGSIGRRETTASEEFPAEPVTAAEITGQRAPAPAGPVVCGWETPAGACNLAAGHPVGPELDGYDGHDVVPAGGTR
jgi:hypothetical protein